MEGDTMGDMPNAQQREPHDAAEGALTQDDFFRKSDSAGSPEALNGVGGGGDGNSDLKRLIRLFTNEDTAEIVERQLVVLRQVCKVRQRG